MFFFEKVITRRETIDLAVWSGWEMRGFSVRPHLFCRTLSPNEELPDEKVSLRKC